MDRALEFLGFLVICGVLLILELPDFWDFVLRPFIHG